ncbi:hypothetical protein IAU60_005952 [Kwoniella sp. DSM 27419]
MSSGRKGTVTPYQSLFAGVVAGAVEGAVTYPTEYIKTRAQFGRGGPAGTSGAQPSMWNMAKETVRSRGVQGLYKGAGALITGNGVKAGVRFLSYDSIKAQLKDRNGHLTSGRTVVAGLLAGVAEAVVAVTPSETIKTKMIQDASSAAPKYKSTLTGTIDICRTEGFRGLYRGVFPTAMKQSANSAVRFTSYSALQNFATKLLAPPSGKLGPQHTFSLGAIAGLITVYATMPFDNVKTRMQTKGAELVYGNSFKCLDKIVRQEGVTALWAGTSPRLARLMLSGGIIFTVYEQVIELF